MCNMYVEQVKLSKRLSKSKLYFNEDKKLNPVYDKVMILQDEEVAQTIKEMNLINVEVETIAHQSALGLEDYSMFDARIEQGALIRKGAQIDKEAIILMGAVINTGAKIGSHSMVDMNAVIGSGAQIGKRCHIGAGAVIAGMMEPKGEIPVILEDEVMIGANAVVLEEVCIGHHSIVGAGAIVTKDVEPHSVVVGNPARKIRENKETWIVDDLR